MAGGLTKRQHCAPMLLDSLEQAATAQALTHVRFTQTDGWEVHTEGWLQRLIHRCPELLPIDEIEPGFGALAPICMELSTDAGSVDNVFVTPEGNMVLAECKRWRNPEARRQVVAQIMDYAQAMSDWSFAELEKAVSSSSHGVSSIYEAVSGDTDLTEERFVDAVSRNLSLGRVHLMLVGDGIRSSAEALANSLQRHPGFHFSLSLVEVPVFRLPDGRYIVAPRILARTVNIERGVVSIVEGTVQFSEPNKEVGAESAARSTISVEQGLEQLRSASSEAADLLESFIEKAQDRRIYLDAATKSLVVRWIGPDERLYALVSISPDGQLLAYNVNWTPATTGHVELAHKYLEAIANLIGCKVHKTPTPENWTIVKKGGKSPPDVLPLLREPEKWLAIIDDYTAELERALKES